MNPHGGTVLYMLTNTKYIYAYTYFFSYSSSFNHSLTISSLQKHGLPSGVIVRKQHKAVERVADNILKLLLQLFSEILI